MNSIQRSCAAAVAPCRQAVLVTEVLRPGPSRFTMSGQSLPPFLHPTAEQISPGLARRLYRYAERELCLQGFGALASDARITIYTIDGDKVRSNRTYCVRWHTSRGGYVELTEILTHHGWPTLHHGFDIGFQARAD